MTIDCDEFGTLLDDYLDGDLDAGLLAGAERHLADCGACRRSVEQGRALVSVLAALPIEPHGESFVDDAMRVATESRRPKSLFAGRVVAAAFVATLMLSVVTVIMTGLSVKAPQTQIVAALPSVTMSIEAPRVVNLVFEAHMPLDDVSLLMTLPRGVELVGYPGRSQIEWRTSLVAGKNVVPLELVAVDGMGGQLVAQLGHGELRKVFRVHLDVASG